MVLLVDVEDNKDVMEGYRIELSTCHDAFPTSRINSRLT